MQVIIDNKALHDWARANGYVSGDVVRQIRELCCLLGEDTKPVPSPTITREQIADAVRGVVHHSTPKDLPYSDAEKIGAQAGISLLAAFGAKDVSGVPTDRYAEFMKAAETYS